MDTLIFIYAIAAALTFAAGVLSLLVVLTYGDVEREGKYPARITLTALVWPIWLWFGVRWLWRTADLGRGTR